MKHTRTLKLILALSIMLAVVMAVAVMAQGIVEEEAGSEFEPTPEEPILSEEVPVTAEEEIPTTTTEEPQTTPMAAGTWKQIAAGALSTAAPTIRRAPTAHKLKPTNLWGAAPVNKVPLPTNEWWNNLVIGSGNSPLKTYPYLAKAANTGLKVCYPGRTAAKNFIFETFLDNLSIGTTETLGQRRLTGYSKLHATMRWPTATGPADASLVVPFVRGQAYMTALYTNLTPKISTIHAISSVNGQGGSRTISGKKFKVALNNGQTWLLYTQNTISLKLEGSSLTATGRYSGYIRAAVMFNAAEEAVYDAHKDAIPTAGEVKYDVQQNPGKADKGRVRFVFRKTGSGTLLMFALPHHQDSLVGPRYTNPRINVKTIRGMASPVIGDEWVMEEELTNIGFYARYAIPENEKANLRAAVQRDKDHALGGLAQDPYFGGKQMAKMARLAMIAEQLGMNNEANDLIKKCKDLINPWLNPTDMSKNHLIYDYTWGGIVTARSLGDPAAEFGNGWYNDHHFHYGYFIYTAAVIAKRDPAWGNQHRTKLVEILRDYASPVSDGHFPQLRNKDAYNGFSFASGLFEFADIKNQESTSEAINSYYAVILFGRSFKMREVYDLGRIMLATEIRGAKKYWQIKSDNKIYDEVFKPNKAVGIVWETKVDYATFFGSNVEFIHCIQMLPFVPASEDLLPADWIREEYNVLKTALTRGSPALPEGWKGFIYMAHAIFDKHAARREIDTLKSYDDGNTRSNTLYWTVTRPAPGMAPSNEPGPSF